MTTRRHVTVRGQRVTFRFRSSHCFARGGSGALARPEGGGRRTDPLRRPAPFRVRPSRSPHERGRTLAAGTQNATRRVRRGWNPGRAFPVPCLVVSEVHGTNAHGRRGRRPPPPALLLSPTLRPGAEDGESRGVVRRHGEEAPPRRRGRRRGSRGAGACSRRHRGADARPRARQAGARSSRGANDGARASRRCWRGTSIDVAARGAMAACRAIGREGRPDVHVAAYSRSISRMTMRMTSSVRHPCTRSSPFSNQGPFSTEPPCDRHGTGRQSGHAPDGDRRRSHE